VLMTGYNAAQWIDKAILSLRRQRYCDFTCVIIDDASTDDTLRVARYTVYM
jgi:glycosyltransferase involved in cell wall biosynthesis